MDRIETLIGRRSSEITSMSLFRDAAEVEKETIEELTYIEFPREGVSFVVDENDMVEAIHLYSEGLDSYSQYDGEIPGGLNFAMNQQGVRSVLGSPAAQADEGESFLDKHPAWDVFRVNAVYMNVSYEFDRQSVQQFTLSAESPALPESQSRGHDT
jgi:hypothetical protein